MKIIKKYDILNVIGREKIVAIIRAESEYQAEKAAEALIDGGLSCIELAFTTPFSYKIMEKLSKQFSETQLLIGAGTILDTETARIAILSGAKYLITPCLKIDVIKLGNRYGIPVIPGISNATEALHALEAGADVVKLFPAGQFNKNIIKDLKAPLPNLEIMPTGGVNAQNIAEWISAGAFVCGVGGSLFSGLKDGDYKSITQKAKELLEILK